MMHLISVASLQESLQLNSLLKITTMTSARWNSYNIGTVLENINEMWVHFNLGSLVCLYWQSSSFVVNLLVQFTLHVLDASIQKKLDKNVLIGKTGVREQGQSASSISVAVNSLAQGWMDGFIHSFINLFVIDPKRTLGIK